VLLFLFSVPCVRFYNNSNNVSCYVCAADEHVHMKQKSAFENLDLKEKSTMTFLFGPANLIVSSHMVDCINKFVACAQNHEYEPYSKSTTGIIY